ncbi:MAG: hypothetical protein ACLFR0_04375 [Alphaproteobacteria bacterium]
MRTLQKLTLCLSTLALLGGTSFVAQADYKPNRFNTEPTREQIEEMGFTGILPLDKTGFTIFQRPNTPDNELVFFVMSRVPLEGCFDSIPFEASHHIQGPVLTINLEFPIIQVQKRKDCEKKRVMETTEVILDLDEMRENNVNMLRLSSRYETRSFDVELTDQKISLQPKESVMLEGLEYWFLPANTVFLSVPMATDDLYYKNPMLQELAMLAGRNGLVPIETKIPGYTPSSEMLNTFVFLDTEGDIREMLNNGQEFVNIGSIHKTEPFYGPNGQYDKKIPIDVLATLPASMK